MTTETKSPPVNLFKAMHKARAAMGLVAKGGHNKFDRYDYAKLDNYIDVMQGPLNDNGLIIINNIDSIEWCEDRVTKQGGAEKVCRVRLRSEVVHVDSGESTAIVVMGEGQDRGDKAAYKAYTGARKYALANLFNLATGDDPEVDSHDSTENPFRREQRPAEPAAKPAQEPQPPSKPAPANAEVEQRKAQMKGWPLDKLTALINAAESIPLLDFVVDGAEGGDVWESLVGREALITAIREQLIKLFDTLPAAQRNGALEDAFKNKMRRHCAKLDLDKQFAETEKKFDEQEVQNNVASN